MIMSGAPAVWRPIARAVSSPGSVPSRPESPQREAHVLTVAESTDCESDPPAAGSKRTAAMGTPWASTSLVRMLPRNDPCDADSGSGVKVSVPTPDLVQPVSA